MCANCTSERLNCGLAGEGLHRFAKKILFFFFFFCDKQMMFGNAKFDALLHNLKYAFSSIELYSFEIYKL